MINRSTGVEAKYAINFFLLSGQKKLKKKKTAIINDNENYSDNNY
jgi:hypothetical protein